MARDLGEGARATCVEAVNWLGDTSTVMALVWPTAFTAEVVMSGNQWIFTIVSCPAMPAPMVLTVAT